MKIKALSKTVKIVLLVVFFLVQGAVAADVFTPIETTREQVEQANKYLGKWGLPPPPTSFTRDGCTLFPDTLPLHNFSKACLTHDIGYWAGGDDTRKETIDKEFYTAVKKSGPLGPYLFAPLMYGSTFLFGDSFITTILGTNWGYGTDT